MKRNMQVLVTLVLVLVQGVSAVWAAERSASMVGSSTKTEGFFAQRHADIKIDGDLSEWTWDGAVELNSSTSELAPPPVTSDDDLSAKVKFAWDDKYLYIAAIVRDQSLVPLPRTEAMPWDCDSLILTLRTFGPTKISPRFNVKPNVPKTTDPFFGFSYFTEAISPRKWTTNSHYVTRAVAAGYTVEGAIALADIGFDVRSGDKIKMNFILADHDRDGKFAQLIRGNPVQSVSADSAANYWLDLRFIDAREYAGHLMTVSPKVTSSSELEIQGEIDSFANNLRLQAIRIKDAAGTTLATLPTDIALPRGQRTLISGKVPMGDLKPGKYEVVAVVNIAGKESNGAVHGEFTVVAESEGPQTIVGKLPDRLVTPDPSRLALTINESAAHYKARPITRDDYIQMVRKVVAYQKYVYEGGRQSKVGRFGLGYALPAYAMYKDTGDKKWLDAAMGCVISTQDALKDPLGWSVLWSHYYYVPQIMLQDPTLSQEDRKILTELFPKLVTRVYQEQKPTEWGAFNRAALWGFLLDVGTKVAPDSPHAAAWKAYADMEFDSFWPYRDHDENASDYNCWSIYDLLVWAKFRDPEALRDPGIMKMVERQMYQVTPSGGFPGYGSSNPWNSSCWYWISLFEWMATETKDGRYKWAAHRMLDYANRQMDDLFSYHAVYDAAAFNCALAYLHADESIKEVTPEFKSRVLMRKQVLSVTPEEKKVWYETKGIQGLFFKLTQEMQPDKLLLRAGSDPYAPAGMIELCSHAGHHLSTVPNLANLMANRSVLLTGLGYFEMGPEYKNIVLVEDLTGITPESANEIVTVPQLAVGSGSTYAAIHVENYKNWPVLNDRRVIFTTGGMTLVKDLMHFRRPFVAQLRQQWHTRNIEFKSGENWVNVNIPFLISSGLGLGGAVQKWKNPGWDMLVYFTPQAGRDYEVLDRSQENIWQAVPLRISQRWRGLPQKDQPVHFTTLLWPHKPELNVEKYAQAITVLVDEPSLTIMSVDISDKQRMYLGINDTGALVERGPVATDASMFVLTCSITDGVAKPVQLFARDLTTLKLQGKSVQQSAEKVNVDKAL